jgi:hypothetical protein
MVALYTSIPILEAIKNAIDRIKNITYFLTARDLQDLLTIALNNTYFTFNSKVYLQIQGLPMGCSISSVLARLFMDKLERMTLSQHLLIDPYKCFVDDMYLQTEDENQADNIHRNMNQLHPRIKFEIEKPIKTPEGKTLSLLDFSVTITNEGDASFEFYKKKEQHILYIRFQSIPPHSRPSYGL